MSFPPDESLFDTVANDVPDGQEDGADLSLASKPGLDAAAFLAGMALEKLGKVARDRGEGFPGSLWRCRQALGAVEGLNRLQGRVETAGQIRDAHCFTAAHGDPGPAGNLLRLLHEMVKPAAFNPARLESILLSRVSGFGEEVGALRRGSSRLGESPVARAAHVAAEILGVAPMARVEALVLADVVLAKGLGWSAPVPLLASEIRVSDLRRVPASRDGDPGWVRSCYGAYERAARLAYHVAEYLDRRASALRAGAIALRSKSADAAVSVFLSEEAVSPTGGLAKRVGMTDRAARRLCDRLVSLGLVRELTGRTTHRLYGL